MEKDNVSKLNKALHIVSFNVPYPADYGGVIDVFYRLKALAEAGVSIHLHTFTYGRPQAPELNKYCDSVTYYRRDTRWLKLCSKRPYIVASRDNRELIRNLSRDNYPIFLEGLHCCSVLEALPERRVFVRAHNVEHDYYERLALAEQKLLKRLYLRSDARKLKHYEPWLVKASGVFAVTESDAAHFRSLGCQNVWLMPSSHINSEVVSLTGMGDYAFYHADLSVAENIKAACYLINNIFQHSHHSLVIAGRNPDKSLKDLVAQKENISLVKNPDDETMSRLMSEAQVNIMVTDQPTGLKLKLLNALYAGRHCLVNSMMTAGTELDKVCTVADSPEAMIPALDRLMQQPFTQQDIDLRKQLLGDRYSNQANARILIEKL